MNWISERRLAISEHVGDQAQGQANVAVADGLGQLEHSAFARFRDELFHVGARDAPAGEKGDLFQGMGDAPQIRTSELGQRLHRAGVDVEPAPTGLTRHPGHQVAILESAQLVEETGLAQGREGTQAAVHLVAHQDQTSSRIRVGHELDEGLKLGGFYPVDALGDHQSSLAEHG